MTDGDAVQAQLAEAEQARTEHGRLGERIAALDQQVSAADAEVSAARSKLVDESADVAKLESFSPTRILAALKGDRSERLEQERAEQQAAEYAVATAEARLAQVRADQDDLRNRQLGLGDVEDRWEQALAAKEKWLMTVDPQVGATVSSLSERVGVLRAERSELDEAVDAHTRAVAELSGAQDFLGSARSWSTYDAWFDGGLWADLKKHEKLDEASARMRSADAALQTLATELADVDVAPVGELGITDLSKTFDIWFDNIFSDFSVRNRIMESIERVERTLAALGSVGEQLGERRVSVDAEVAQCAAEREELLRG